MLLTASISQTDRQRRTKFGDLLREFQQRQTSAAVSAITGIAGIAIATEMVASHWIRQNWIAAKFQSYKIGLRTDSVNSVVH